MRKRFTLLVFVIGGMCTLLIFSACSNNAGGLDDESDGGAVKNEEAANTGKDPDNNEPVNHEDNDIDGDAGDQEEVTIYWANDWDYDMNVNLFKEPIEAALPHITIEILETNTGEGEVEQYVAAQNIPDIYWDSGLGMIQNLERFELEYDLEPLLDRNNFDLSRIDDSILQEVRNASLDGGLYVLPLQRNATNLYYNKDVFDIFGVNYPTDNMTWDEVIDRAADLTGTEDNRDYHGFDIMMPSIMLDQRQVTHIHPQTHDVQFMDEPIYTEYLQKLERLWNIPGIFPDDRQPDEYLHQWGHNFLDDLNVAMTINWNAFHWTNGIEGLNWDIVTQPVWEDQPNVGNGATGFSVAVTSTGAAEKEDAIFEVLNVILSDEHQAWMSATDGRATVLNSPEVQETLATEMEGMEDKNVESAFLLESNPGIPRSELSPLARYNTMWDAVVEDFAFLQKDINTFLREVTESTEEEIRLGIAAGEEDAVGVWAE